MKILASELVDRVSGVAARRRCSSEKGLKRAKNRNSGRFLGLERRFFFLRCWWRGWCVGEAVETVGVSRGGAEG